MAYIKIGENYYNELALAKLYTVSTTSDGTETTQYFVQTLGGQTIELTQEEYNSIIGG